MADDEPRRIESAPSRRAEQARADAEREQAEAQRSHFLEAAAADIADELQRVGSVVINCGDAQAQQHARIAGRKAGRLISRSVRTTVLPDGSVAVWDAERATHPLHAHLDEVRANQRLDRAFHQRGPLLSEPGEDGHGEGG